jgi:cytochrome c peroxidase
VFANVGKSIAAFERTISPERSRFDDFADALASGGDGDGLLTPAEIDGLRLFVGKGNCTRCHNGPLLTDNHFHNTGVPSSKSVQAIDSGRTVGVRQAVAGEFNCTSRYSDAKPDDCEELTFAVTEGNELVRAYKTPSLRNVAGRAPYMHAGQLGSLGDVLAHYNAAPAAPFGKSELRPLHLTPMELNQLAAFLKLLTTPVATPKGWLEPPSTHVNGDKCHVSGY